MQEVIRDCLDWCYAFAPKLLAGILLFAAAWLCGRIARSAAGRVADRFEKGKRQVIRLGGRIAYGTILIVGAVTALGSIGVNVSALVAGLGLTGFALGFAFRDALANTLAGTMLLVYQPFRAGDTVSVAGCEGEVAEINLRYTVIRAEGRTHLLPNSLMLTSPIAVLRRAGDSSSGTAPK